MMEKTEGFTFITSGVGDKWHKIKRALSHSPETP